MYFTLFSRVFIALVRLTVFYCISPNFIVSIMLKFIPLCFPVFYYTSLCFTVFFYVFDHISLCFIVFYSVLLFSPCFIVFTVFHCFHGVSLHFIVFLHVSRYSVYYFCFTMFHNVLHYVSLCFLDVFDRVS